jgi:hypothetical protein
MENSETQVWLDFALACEYISKEEFHILFSGQKKLENY